MVLNIAGRMDSWDTQQFSQNGTFSTSCYSYHIRSDGRTSHAANGNIRQMNYSKTGNLEIFGMPQHSFVTRSVMSLRVPATSFFCSAGRMCTYDTTILTQTDIRFA
jgi:hypothetical protein